MGRMSRCTPSRLTSGPWPRSRPAILSISSRKMMPDCSARSLADLHFHRAFVELAFANLGAKFFSSALERFRPVGRRIVSTARRSGLGREQEVEQPVFGVLLGLLGDLVQLFLAHHVNRNLHQV